jgi:tetratricopeptide (TPR) repeat protein
VTNESYLVGGEQKGIHSVHVSAQSRSDATSKGNCVVDFLMAPEDRHQAAFRKLADERLVKEGKAPAAGAEGAPDAPGMPPARAAGEPVPTDPLEKGKALISSRDYAGAIEPLKEAVASKPENGEGYRWLGSALLQVGNLAEAEPALKKAIELDPSFSGVNFDMGMLYVKKGRLMQAIPHFEKELEINPGSPAVLQNLAKLYTETKQYDKAIGIYTQLIETSPDNMENYAMMADCYKQMGDIAKEQEVYQKMGASDTSGMAFYNLGNLMFNKDEKAKAAEAYKKALEQNPQHADAHFQLGMTYVGLAKFKEAVAELEAFVKIKPADPKAAEARSMVVDLKKMGG